MDNKGNIILPPELQAKMDLPGAMILAADPGNRIYECPNCFDGHMIGVFVPSSKFTTTIPNGKPKYFEGKGWANGETTWAFCPVCRGDQQNEFYKRYSGLEGSDFDISLSDFKVEKYPQKALGLQTIKELLAMNNRVCGFVTLWGNYGVGKTHLLKGLTNGLIAIHVYAHYARLSDLIAEIREGFNEGERPEIIIDHYRRIQALMIDEIDKISLTGWTKEVLFRLLDARHNDRYKLLTVLATNTKPAELPADLGYLRSRMAGGIIVEVGGEDMRPTIAYRDYTV